MNLSKILIFVSDEQISEVRTSTRVESISGRIKDDVQTALIGRPRITALRASHREQELLCQNNTRMNRVSVAESTHKFNGTVIITAPSARRPFTDLTSPFDLMGKLAEISLWLLVNLIIPGD